MASITTLYGPDGKPRAYKVRYWTAEGVQASKTLRRKHDADRFAVDVEDAKYQGLNLDPRLTVETYGERWRAAQIHRETTARRVRIVLHCHLYPVLGSRRILTVTHTDMQSWVKGRAGAAAPQTLRSEWTWVRTLFNAAVADRVIPFSPCVRVSRLAPLDVARPTVPTLEEIEAITAELPPRWAAIGLLGAQSGLRPGELRGLCVEQVDFLRKTITVDRQHRAGRIVAEPKTSASRRVVPIDDVTVDLLAAQLAGWGPGDGGVIFHKVTGAPLGERETAKSWARAVERTGIGRRVRLHDMRHFYVTALIAAGAPLLDVQANAGHLRLAETTDTYGHARPADQDVTRALIGAVFAPRAEPAVSSACPAEQRSRL
jgi:integrase